MRTVAIIILVVIVGLFMSVVISGALFGLDNTLSSINMYAARVTNLGDTIDRNVAIAEPDLIEGSVLGEFDHEYLDINISKVDPVKFRKRPG